MLYTEGEIVNSYRLARNKTEQIKILSQLNLVTYEAIKKILRKHGQKVGERTGRAKSWTAEQERQLVKLQMDGVGRKKIAEIMKRTYSSICGKLEHMQKIGLYTAICDELNHC